MTILKEINDYKLKFVKIKARYRPIEELKSSLKIDEAKNFLFSKKLFQDKDHTSFIGEVKRASPSAGKIIEDEVDILDIVKKYEINSVSCLSILTDEKYFNGSNEDLINIKKHTYLPILRKEFIVDEYQIYESKYIGADCILIIMALLDFDTATKFENLAHQLGLDVLIEVHNKQELEQALKMKSRLIGINNRNLNDFSVDINNCIKLCSIYDSNKLFIAESGISKVEDVNLIQSESSINTFLIGEALINSDELLKYLNNNNL
tara:strand:+ start:689 stop:1477 length:789 start_codon:yes stop_codon:yes gene_type:complete